MDGVKTATARKMRCEIMKSNFTDAVIIPRIYISDLCPKFDRMPYMSIDWLESENRRRIQMDFRRELTDDEALKHTSM